MKDKANLLRLHSIADAYGRRPSEIAELKTPWGAYQFDEMCLIVGRRVEDNLSNGRHAFEGFGSQPSAISGQRAYRSAKHLAKKKVRINANGTW